jgi:hypothetical protein
MNIFAVQNVFSFMRVRACREGGQNPLKRGVETVEKVQILEILEKSDISNPL